MYPHNAVCFYWDDQDRLVCTPTCRQHHRRPWKIRRERDEGCGCLPGQPYWTVYRAVLNGWSPAASADTFAEALRLLSHPLTAPEMAADHVSA